MKHLRILAQDVEAMLRREWKSIVLILIFLSMSIGVSFPMIAYCKSEIPTYEEVLIERRTYSLFLLSPNDVGKDAPLSIEYFDDIFFSEKYPEVVKCYNEIAFLEGDAGGSIVYRETDEYGNVTFLSNEWYPYFDEETILAYGTGDKVTEGEWFTPELVEKDPFVAVVSRERFGDVSVGDTIESLGREFKVIGISETENFMPYQTMKALSTRESNYMLQNCKLMFKEPLSDEQLNELQAEGVVHASSLFSVRSGSYIMMLIFVAVIVMGIFMIIVLNISQLFLHLIRQNKYRFMVLKACGARGGLIFVGLYLMPVLTTLASYLVGLLLYIGIIEPQFIRPLEYSTLAAADYLVVLGMVLVFAFIVLLPTAKRTIKAQPADMSKWR